MHCGRGAADRSRSKTLSYVVVDRMAVSQETHGRGIAGRCLDEVERGTLRHGVTNFHIDTNLDNNSTHRKPI